MKLVTKAILALLFLLPVSAFAQAKFGHTDSQKLLDAMPEVARANRSIDSLQRDYSDKLKSLQERYQKLVDDYQTAAQKTPPLSDAVLKNMVQEIKQLEERMVSFQNDAKTDLQKQQEALYTPINKRLREAIKEVAKEGGYSYVFDTNQVLYASESEDVTSLVRKKLEATNAMARPADNTPKPKKR